MTVLDQPRTLPASNDRDHLIAGTLPYLAGAYGNEARTYLMDDLGLTHEQVLELVAKSVVVA